MTTVLSVGDSEGERRCDSRCHDAGPFTECDCVCGGRYHGAGSRGVERRVAKDVLDGVFGPTISLAGARTLKAVRGRDPETVRFHEGAVHKALMSRRQSLARAH